MGLLFCCDRIVRNCETELKNFWPLKDVKMKSQNSFHFQGTFSDLLFRIYYNVREIPCFTSDTLDLIVGVHGFFQSYTEKVIFMSSMIRFI